ncbi:hypothetical protein EV715DRAFT_278453 [Schizophyllum commune]
MDIHCPGCGKKVKATGLSEHIRKTTNAVCIAYHEDLASRTLSARISSSLASRTASPSPSPSTANVYDSSDPRDRQPIETDAAGDALGDYDTTDFPGLEDVSHHTIAMDIDGEEGSLLPDAHPSADIEVDFDADSEDGDDAATHASDAELDELDAVNAELEEDIEPDRPLGMEEDHDDGEHDGGSALDDESDVTTGSAAGERDHAEQGLRQRPFIVQYPGGMAGRPMRAGDTAPHQAYARHFTGMDGTESDPYGAFGHRLAWEVARWAKMRGPSSTAFTELMQIDGVVEKLELPFRNSAELNRLIDDDLPGRPAFTRKQIELDGEVYDLYFRDILECVKALIGDLDFCPVLQFVPEKHYTDSSRSQRLYHDMHTGRWWWDTQKQVEARRPGATIIPIILSSDKTQLTLFRNKNAYPLYMTIGNIPKEIRRKPSARAYVLLGYLPATRLLHIKNLAARRRCLANLFHASIRHILRPLEEAGLNGCALTTADGKTRRCHPIYACSILDYPEQLLSTCAYNGDCAQCTVPNASLGEFERSVADGKESRLRDLDALVKVFDSFDDNPDGYIQRCKKHRVRPVIKPFWRNLPYSHAYRAITPDVLHQLYQGVVKHLLEWLKSVFGAAEMDARCRRLPPNHSIRIFMSGISALSHVTGQTHDEICRVVLGLVIDAVPQDDTRPDPRIVRCTRAILDFLYLAQYPVHTDDSLTLMNDALEDFHKHKSVFVDLGIRSDFNLPKLHFAQHYLTQIKLFGTTDNFNTQYTERLHIDLAKHAYAATNHKDEFSQMTRWLERREKILQHEQYIAWRLAGCLAPRRSEWSPPGLELGRTAYLSKHPSSRATLSALCRDYGATFIVPALRRFVAMTNDPSITSKNQLELAAGRVFLPFASVEVWHHIKFIQEDVWMGVENTVDSIHARPERRDTRGRRVPQRFDTALIDLANGEAGETGVKGYRVGRIRAIFSIPRKFIPQIFVPGVPIPRHMAYVEWYSNFTPRPDPNHRMYKISPVAVEGGILSSVVPVPQIRRSVHLFPKFGRTAPIDWTTNNVLDMCKTFYINSFTDRHLYRILY